jgi:hypothetical protein
LVVLYLDEEKTKEKRIPHWVCKCDCGTIKTINGYSLIRGATKSCGCLQREKTSLDITGQHFGKLTALYKTNSRKDT